MTIHTPSIPDGCGIGRFSIAKTTPEIETLYEHCLSTELELDDREGTGVEYILNCQYCETTVSILFQALAYYMQVLLYEFL
jgi:hypothetical protein